MLKNYNFSRHRYKVHEIMAVFELKKGIGLIEPPKEIELGFYQVERSLFWVTWFINILYYDFNTSCCT